MMSSRGHQRTALECRNKTKAMRLEYKRVIAHNSTSGNGPVTCPYFRELDSILRGDASVKPRRIARSLNLGIGPQELIRPDVIMEGSEELFTHDLVTVDSTLLRTSSPTTMYEQNHSTSSTDVADDDLDRTIDGLEDKENDPPGANAEGDADSESDLPMGHRLRDNNGRLNACLAELSPGTRLNQIRNRKRRNAALYGVADQMMNRSRQEHDAHLAEWRIDREVMCEWRSDERRLQREFLEQARSESDNFARAWQQNIAVMTDAVQTLKALGEMLTSQRQQPLVTQETEQLSQDVLTVSNRHTNSRRSCVGKPRDRLTL
ncbi:uncharacterized protein LOC129342295 [Eublepharis macularius]|uniref:Uncharacterized protein LOC129340950 n=1 Tax=Eublepharis macularius TaxID=481883 RepID=A0AA97LE76_EUBMA|nr:uncharacterized protein LOC129340950 [Eublepharis macularius]XP_054853958.1 uncharacterized protein LOC129342295 [Eublepharis macularius]